MDCIGADGRYMYTEDLLKLSCGGHCRPAGVAPCLRVISTPLNIAQWRLRLQNHPDHDFSHWLLDGIEGGFHIGMQEGSQLRPAERNMQSARDHPQIIEDYIQTETAQGRILGPYSPSSMTGIHTNRFGVIPKKHRPNKWRLITDLSFPAGYSVNDAIDPALCSLQYISVDQVAIASLALGRGALLAKADIQSAYRLIPVHPEDRIWLGMQWKGALFVDGMLPFGLRSAPKIFSAVADALEWCIHRRGVQSIFHYLDDFVVMGGPGSDTCKRSLDLLISECHTLGVPLAAEKMEGPSPVLTFLGIEIDTHAWVMRLPQDKLQRLLSAIGDWLHRKTCTRKELESLIGTLQHACSVIRPGRSFLRRAIALLSMVKQPFHHIRLNKEFQADLLWWKTFATHWNGTALILDPNQPHPIVITSDASGSWGCGAWCDQQWFQLQWDHQSQEKHIAVKELLPVVIAAVIWGHQWSGHRVLSNCDNQAVVAVLNSRYSKEKDLMQLLRCLFFVEATCQFHLTAAHLPGVLNECADDLSRNRLPAFHRKMPQAASHPSPIPPSLLQWLLHPDLNWTSPSWTQQFSSSVTRA